MFFHYSLLSLHHTHFIHFIHCIHSGSPVTSPFDSQTDQPSQPGLDRSSDRSERSTERSDAKRPRRSVGRGASLPTGRAAIGGLLVVLAGVGLYLASVRATSTPTANYVVAARDLNEGQILTDSDLATIVGEANSAISSNSFTLTTPLVGAVVLGPISAGELIQGSIVQRGGLSLREMSFPVPRAQALNGSLDSGDRIDVVAVGSSDQSATILSDVKVTNVSGGGLEVDTSDTLVITVSLSNETDQVALAGALGNGKVYIVRANDTGTKTLPIPGASEVSKTSQTTKTPDETVPAA
jgi:SAF domain